jgi:3-methyladenine DNA glycosylase AlkD
MTKVSSDNKPTVDPITDATDFVMLAKRTFAGAENSEQAGPMSAYMKHKFPFLGIKKPLRSQLTRDLINNYGVPKGEELKEAIRLLFDEEQREYHYLALDLFEKHIKKIKSDDIDLIEWMITNHSWWDSVDLIASKFAGTYFLKFPERMHSITRVWNEHENMWLRRTSIIFQLSYKQRTDEELLFSYCANRSHEKEFFIQKAIGWALRQYARTDTTKVKNFVLSNNLAPLSKREALKHIGSI